MVQFRPKKGVSDEVLIKTSDKIMDELRIKRGYIKRWVVKDENGTWIDFVCWNSLDDAKRAAKSVLRIPVCLEYFNLIDESTIKMSHLEQIQSYD